VKFPPTLKPALLASILFTLLLGILYPLFLWAASQLLFHRSAGGSLVENGGAVIGSELIGQKFSAPKYFHPRPSSAGDGYDAANSSASNLGPTSQKLIDALAERASAYRSENQIPPGSLIPADAVTGSGSGLDPHISPENAKLQAARVAAARNLPLASILQAIDEATEGRDLWIFGNERVNVLKLNLALDSK